MYKRQVLAGTQLLHFYSSDAAVIAAGYERLRVICGTYLLCGIMDTLASSLQLRTTPVSYTHLLLPDSTAGAWCRPQRAAAHC